MPRKTINWGTDEEFIKNYYELQSSRKMGELYNCDKSSVLNHAKKIGFDVNLAARETKLSNEDKEYIKNAYENETSSSLAEKFNVSRGMITKIWYDNNLKGKETTKNTIKGNNLLGMTFGNLTVVAASEKRASNGGKYWKCICNCGKENCLKEKEILGQSLKSGRTISCGAVGKDNLKIGQGLNFNDLTNKVFGKLTVIKRIEDKILNDRPTVQWLCKCDCGRETAVLSSNLVTGNTQSCGYCGNNSHGNTKIEQLLKEANISFQREKRFSECKDIMSVPFDFYVDNKYLIEFDGRQHFVNEDSIYDYESTHKHDLIKNQWCKENNIPLIRIPYTHYDNLCLEDLILETSSFIIK